MATLKDRFQKWKETRSKWQKAGDIFFWLLLIMLIIPGPRKVVSTAVNKISLNVRNPTITKPENQAQLSDTDYEWNLRDEDGKVISFDSFRDDVVFLNFWATWCPPCIAELPEIESLYNKFGKDVVFLLVTNEDPDKVKAFMQKHDYDLPVYYSTAPPPIIFSGRAIPSTFIISDDGRIVTKKTGAANWDSRATTRIFRDLLP